MSTSPRTPSAALAAIARPDRLILARTADRLGMRTELRREHDCGRLIRLRGGAYMLTGDWSGLNRDERYLSRIRAHAAMSEEPPVFSHFSAAAIWGLPKVGAWPTSVDVLIPSAAGGRSGHGVRRHTHTTESVCERDGLLVTSPAATAVTMGRVLPFTEAVAMMDKTIHLPRMGTPLATRTDLEAALESLGHVHGRTAALRAGDFATTLSDSPGESISRANMFLLGFLLPGLQVRFDDSDGFVGFVDCYWPTLRTIGEFDGKGKYLRDEFTRGRSAAQIVVDEKIREDRLRALGNTVFRWGWELALDLNRFGSFLERNGIPRARASGL